MIISININFKWLSNKTGFKDRSSSSFKRSILRIPVLNIPTDNRTGNLSNKAPLTDMLLLVVKAV
jgi:hypothetical protein